MAVLYDEDGNPVENALTPEEAKELQERATRAEELEAQMKEKESELTKLKNKDMNFQRFREKSEEEKSKIMEKATEKEKMILLEMEEISQEREKERVSRMKNTKENVLSEVAGDDKDLQKKIELKAKEWGEAKNPEDMEKKLRDAAIIVRGSAQRVSPLSNYFPTSSYNAPYKPKVFVDTEAGKATYRNLFGHEPGSKNKK